MPSVYKLEHWGSVMRYKLDLAFAILHITSSLRCKSLLWKTWIQNRHHRDNDDQQLCNDDDFFVPRFRTDFKARLPLFNLPKIWSDTPSLLTSTTHKLTFSTQTFKYLFDQLSRTPNCNRLVCPACIFNNLHN
jgi:hypothetical protein